IRDRNVTGVQTCALPICILDFPDLTVETSFATGGATVATAIVAGINPAVGMLLAFVAGCIAGAITGILHAKGKINNLLAGIISKIGRASSREWVQVKQAE